MPDDADAGNEERIRASWRDNARAWTNAVRGGAIESRVEATDDAIIGAVLDAAGDAATVIDIGCGEGWLVRALAARGLNAFGVDGTAELVERARAGGGRFALMSYADLATRRLDRLPRAQVAVCNFSLIGETSTRDVFRALPRLLERGGRFVVQTLHPGESPEGAAVEDGWLEGSWRGFSSEFTRPAPWYFRTLDSWRRLFAEHGLTGLSVREPPNPATGRPASVIFTACLG